MSRGLPARVRALGRSRGRPALTGACAAAIAVLLAGCGTSGSSSSGSAATVSGRVLDVVASEPTGSSGGQVAADVLDAERLALAQSGGKAGAFQLRFVLAHRAEVSADARKAVSDAKAIAYLGEIAPGTSGVSLQITNELGMLQVSPSDTAAYLTQSTPGAGNPPGHYYPASSSYGRTFARLAPTTVVEASALVARMRAEKLTNLDVQHDTTPYGTSLADAVSADARRAGMTVTRGAATPAAKVVLYAGLPDPAAAHALDVAASTAPSAKLFAPSALYDDTFVHGLSTAAQQALTVSAPGIASGALDAIGRGFVSDFAHRYGHQPAPQAIFGYEAMRALIATLQKAGVHANARTTVVTDFRSLSRTAAESALGAYRLQGGDTSLRSFVFAHVSNGALVPVK